MMASFSSPLVATIAGTVATVQLLLLAVLLHPSVGAQELFAFPADVVVSPNLENARNRTPVYIPGKCSTNEILYPGDHDSDWVCDCRPGYVYSPPQDSCYPLFQQGFCQPGEYVDLARPSMIVKCTRNVCTGRNEVPYREQCVKLHQNNRLCKIERRVSWVIGVNITTLELDCIAGTTDLLEITVNNRNMEDGDETDAPVAMKMVQPVYFKDAKLCQNGTKSMYNGRCP
uniref:DUF4789 domain-containing protein n=1 Tax=Anopheles quadriannulatus TaxID=34691 RepID=A0A182WST5_ANOQN